MKLSTLANSYLEYMIKNYSQTHNKYISWKDIKSLHLDQDDEFICDAFRLLHSDGLVDSFWTDDVVDTSTINVTAIRDAEKNTRLLKTYKVLKELREWI